MTGARPPSGLRVRRGGQHYRYFMNVWNIDLNLKLFPSLGVYYAAAIDGARARRTAV